MSFLLKNIKNQTGVFDVDRTGIGMDGKIWRNQTKRAETI